MAKNEAKTRSKCLSVDWHRARAKANFAFEFDAFEHANGQKNEEEPLAGLWRRISAEYTLAWTYMYVATNVLVVRIDEIRRYASIVGRVDSAAAD